MLKNALKTPKPKLKTWAKAKAAKKPAQPSSPTVLHASSRVAGLALRPWRSSSRTGPDPRSGGSLHMPPHRKRRLNLSTKGMAP